ncbi:MAG: ShlB/FhaC/HecB family hemolysin secretion/activation protein [Proteobacteria bacterium]|nr:ShlB/FhaC/HecB family hemolysin secretion/activation protein [Burkholderiales bacterium]
MLLALVAAGIAAPASAQPAPGLGKGADAPASEVLLVVTRYQVIGTNPLGAEETEAVLKPYLGEHRSLASLEASAIALETRMRERGFAFHRVIVPAQRPELGVVRLEVLRFTLGNVNVSGNRFFTRENVLKSVPALKTGDAPDVVELARQLSLANEHPAKRLTVTMRESTTSDALDAEVQVRDVQSSQLFIGLVGNTRDEYNLINRNTGYTRLTLGYQNSNLFDLDHVGTLAYTTSPEELDAVRQYAGFYSLPLYALSSQVSAFYVQSDVDTGSVPVGGVPFNVSGRGKFYGARFTYTLPRVADVTQLLSVAYDVRSFENTIDVLGGVLPGTPVTTRPLSVRYQARGERAWGGASGYVEYAVNVSGSDSASFDAARNGATDSWDAFRAGFDANYLWNRWVLATRLRGQFSSDILIPGEQFGVGGATSVRGLREREYAGERGYSVTLEGVGPALVGDARPVVFLDHGYAYQRQTPLPVAGVINGGQSATSTGVGVRWNWQRKLDVSADLAYVLEGLKDAPGVEGTPAGHVKLHFSVFYRF